MENTCSTCNHWHDTFGDKKVAVLGYCRKLEVGDLIMPCYKDTPNGYADCFITSFEFGCNQWEREES